MAKKTKELEPIEEKKAKVEKTSVAKSAKSKKTASAKSAKVKKTVATSKVTPSKKAETKKENTSKKSETKKASKVKDDKTAKTTKSKKAEAKKTKNTAATKKSTSRKKSTASNKIATKAEFKAEYYDLPFMYNKTVVRVLAQTPKMLFIYWEISDEDRSKLIDSFGENFFNSTKPVLIVYNDTLNYSFEVTIDDFANSWYLHIDDANCEYHVELGRKPINHAQQYNQPVYIPYYIYITSSNEMVSPNNRILFDFNKTIKFKNVKTGQIIEKDINQFKFITNYGIFSIQDLYKYLYPNENFEVENIELTGSSSKSGMFSSQFK
ncbi:MAG: DUF4912 domain-containing protein [Clostridia bacterium]|nr:DUF4912 domain-containing protein [Clostridia bacterium]